MFEKTLNDLIRGLRANRGNEDKYIRQAVVECRREASSQDLDVKAGALLKLAYLNMFGQDMDWAAFQTVEVMASSRFVNKRIGYMSASLGFTQTTDVLMLATNLIKKDIFAANAGDVCVALGGLADIVTPDLARDLAPDVTKLLNHSKALVRRKAVLTLYKIFLRYPEALRSSYPKLCEMLEDEDQSVVSAAVSVITELSRKNSKNYLTLAPALFNLLTTSTNNWMLIKIVKLFATMLPLEPRLVKKLISPLTDLVQATTAMSLLYECINTVVSTEILSHPSSDFLTRLCVTKLRTFFSVGDQNLKYVALLAFGKIMNTRPELILPCQDLIMECIDDADSSVRLRALDLVSYMPTRSTLPDIVRRLMLQLLPSSKLSLTDDQRKHIVHRILEMCRKETYGLIDDFDWYMSVLVDLVKVARTDIGGQLCDEIRNVCVRVEDIREFALPLLADLATSREQLEQIDRPQANGRALIAAVWCVGEFAGALDSIEPVLDRLLEVKPGAFQFELQHAYLSGVIKLFARWASQLPRFDAEARMAVQGKARKLLEFARMITSAQDVETQRRALEVVAVMNVGIQAIEEHAVDLEEQVPAFFTDIMPSLYLGEALLKPVSDTAQQHIKVPDQLDLDADIYPPTPPISPIQPARDSEDILGLEDAADRTEEERLATRKSRQERCRDDPFYIAPDASERSISGGDLIRVADLDTLPDAAQARDEKPRRRAKRSHKPVVILQDEMPDGVVQEPVGQETAPGVARSTNNPAPRNVLRVDHSGLALFDLSKQDASDAEVDELDAVLRARTELQQAPREAGKMQEKAVSKKRGKKKKKSVADEKPSRNRTAVASSPVIDVATEPEIVDSREHPLLVSAPAESMHHQGDGYLDLNEIARDEDGELEVVRKPKRKSKKAMS